MEDDSDWQVTKAVDELFAVSLALPAFGVELKLDLPQRRELSHPSILSEYGMQVQSLYKCLCWKYFWIVEAIHVK